MVFKEIIRDLQTDYWAVHIKVPAGSVNVVRMSKYNIILEELLMVNDRELQKTQRELLAAVDAVLEAQHLAWSKSEKARSCS